MKAVVAKGARNRYPDFPFSYDKLCALFERIGIDRRTVSHGETPTDLYVRVLPVKNPPTEEQLNTLKNALNDIYSEANFEIVNKLS